MSRIFKRPEADKNLDEIWWHIAQDSLQNADRFLDRILEKCMILADFPKIGTERDELVNGLRSQPVGCYTVFYFPLDDGIDIVRVLHGSRDVESMF